MIRTIFTWAGSIITIIIAFFQEDNILGTNDSLTYGPQLQQ